MLKGIARADEYMTRRADEYMTRRASTVCLNSKSNTGAGLMEPPTPSEHCPEIRVVVWIVLASFLLDFDDIWGNTRYMYDLNFCKVSLLSIHLARSLSRPKHGTGPLDYHDIIGFGLERPSTHSKSSILAPNSRADAQC